MRHGDNKEDKELFKQAIKEAAKEWLDEQFKNFGKWAALGIASLIFVGLFKAAVAFKLLP